MTRMLSFVFLLLCSLLPAQSGQEGWQQTVQKLYPSIDTLTVVSTTPMNGGLNALFSNGVMAMVSVADDGTPVITMMTNAQGPIQTQEPVQCLVTTWTDATGVVHTVSTPVTSSQPAGIKRAREQHADAVKYMQGLYPPKTT